MRDMSNAEMFARLALVFVIVLLSIRPGRRRRW